MYNTLDAIIKEINPIFATNPAPTLVEGYRALDQLSEMLLVNSFQRMGLFLTNNEIYHLDELKTKIRLMPKYEGLFRELLKILVHAGYLQEVGGGIKTLPLVNTQKITTQTLQGAQQQLLMQYPCMQAFIDLLIPCVTQLQQILCGELDATDVLFPDFSMELIENVYKLHPSTYYCNQLVANSIVNYIKMILADAKRHEKIRILEVGAGTGGTSAAIFKMIDPYGEHIEYYYTDISRVFLNHAKAAYLDQHPYIKLQLFNVEKPIADQEFLAESFDMIVATNVLHTTKRIDQSLQQITALLKPHGYFMLNEVMGVEHFTTLTFGLLDGWWLFEDVEDRLPGSPLLSPALWRKQLGSSHFNPIVMLGELDGSKKQSGYSALDVIIAQKSL